VVLDVSAAADATPGARPVSVGDSALADAFVVFDTVARVEVVPPVTFARVGGNAGPIPKVPAQFEAVGYMAGPDGEAGTDDDIRIGAMPAQWRTDNFDATAEALEDARFAGEIRPDGLFVPAPAGPNPMRPMGTNNVGNLSVIASVADGDRTVEGAGQLYVTVQRFVDPPIR
jgi:quinohemoprotein amine dehydrogenase